MTQVKDITDGEIILACQAYHAGAAPTPDIALVDKYPQKVILKKMEKMVLENKLEYGVTLRTAWVVR